MPSLGPLEIMAVAVIALVVFGPQRLPEIARNIGKAINEMRRMTSEMKSELEAGMTEADADEHEVPEPAHAVPADPDEQER